MEKVLITGGAGFIGTQIVNELNGKYEIVVLDNFSKQIHGENYEESYLYNLIKDKCEIIRGDVRLLDDIERAISNVDYIIHLAAETGTGQSMYEINKYTDVNIMGMSNIFQSMLTNGREIKKLVLASSRSVYGEGQYKCNKHGNVLPNSRVNDRMKKKLFEVTCPLCNEEVELLKTSENCLTNPISYYAYTKLAQEKMIELMCATLKIPYTIFRYQNVYGAGQSLSNPYTGILSIFSKQLLSDKDINIFEDGMESRDFVHVSDIVRGTISSLKENKSDNKIINLGSGERVTVLKVAETLKELYASNSIINITGDFRVGDIRHNVADISLAEKLLSYKPEYSFIEGMREFSEWVKIENLNDRVDNSNEAFELSISELESKGMLFKGKEDLLK